MPSVKSGEGVFAGLTNNILFGSWAEGILVENFPPVFLSLLDSGAVCLWALPLPYPSDSGGLECWVCSLWVELFLFILFVFFPRPLLFTFLLPDSRTGISRSFLMFCDVSSLGSFFCYTSLYFLRFPVAGYYWVAYLPAFMSCVYHACQHSVGWVLAIV